MTKRRRFKQTKYTLSSAMRVGERGSRSVVRTTAGSDRDALINRARQAETAAQIDKWVSSPGCELAAPDVALDTLVSAARDAVVKGSLGQIIFKVEVRNGTGPVLALPATFNSKFFRTQ